MTKEEVLTEIRKLRRDCEIRSAEARYAKDHSNARHYAAKVDAYDTAEKLILAMRVPF